MMKLKLLLTIATLPLLGACAQGPSGLQWGEAVAAGSQSSGGTGGGSGGASLNNADEAASMVIIERACTSCHTSSSGPYNVYNLTDTSHLVTAGLVMVGSPSQSQLYQVIANGTMPPAGALSASDAATISNWISGQ